MCLGVEPHDLIWLSYLVYIYIYMYTYTFVLILFSGDLHSYRPDLLVCLVQDINRDVPEFVQRRPGEQKP